MCIICLRIDLLLFAFRANMCTPKGNTPPNWRTRT
nr:MAG TPA: hypothetical protein [Bacteriophage sp.]